MRVLSIIVASFLWANTVLSGQEVDEACLICQESEVKQPEFAQTKQVLPDGLNLDNIDAVVRVRNRNGSGTGSIYGETQTTYKVVTNYHVAGRSGSTNTIDIWNNGQLVRSVQAQVKQHFFTRGTNKDISLLEIPKAALPGEQPVIPMAEYASESVKVGDRIWQVGCDAGNWTNAERGIVLAIEDGVVFYLPNSIPGNSGGPIFSSDCSKQLGITTWVGPMTIQGKHYPAVGMAQTYDRFWNIVNGRVNMDLPLPATAEPIPLSPPINEEDLLPLGAACIPLATQSILPENSSGFSIDQSSIQWRRPGSRNDGRIAPKDKDAPSSGRGADRWTDRRGPLGLGLMDNSVLRFLADFILFVKWALLVGILLFVFTIVTQTLGPGWLRDFMVIVFSWFKKGWQISASAFASKGKRPDLSSEERQEFEAWKRNRKSTN